MQNIERPVGISILAVLLLVGGVLGTILAVFMAFLVYGNSDVEEGLATIGMPLELLIPSVALLLGLSLAAGIGMWKGRKWGWYFGSFYFLYGIARNVNALFLISGMADLISSEGGNMPRDPSFYYVKHGVRSIFSFLIFLYFFKGNVRDFFGLTGQKKWKPVLVEVGICTAIIAAVRMATLMLNG